VFLTGKTGYTLTRGRTVPDPTRETSTRPDPYPRVRVARTPTVCVSSLSVNRKPTNVWTNNDQILYWID